MGHGSVRHAFTVSQYAALSGGLPLDVPMGEAPTDAQWPVHVALSVVMLPEDGNGKDMRKTERFDVPVRQRERETAAR